LALVKRQSGHQQYKRRNYVIYVSVHTPEKICDFSAVKNRFPKINAQKNNTL